MIPLCHFQSHLLIVFKLIINNLDDLVPPLIICSFRPQVKSRAMRGHWPPPPQRRRAVKSPKMAGEVTGSNPNHTNTAGSDRRRDQSQPSASNRDTLRANENPLFILENAFVESNCSDFMDLASMNGSCGNFTVASNFTNSTSMAGDSYYFYEVSDAVGCRTFIRQMRKGWGYWFTGWIECVIGSVRRREGRGREGRK